MAETVDLSPTQCRFESDYGYMGDMVMRVNTTRNRCLGDDDFVDECMKKLMFQYPEIESYTFIRTDESHIEVMIWGEHLNFELDK